MSGKELNKRMLKGNDILFNLKEIDIDGRDSRSSLSCAGYTAFYFENETKHGYMEDPDLTGTIKVLDVQKKKGHYLLKIKLKRETEDTI